MQKVKVLSLMQPWAQLVVEGHKELETRSWTTKYRGELFIHASRKFFYADLELCKQDRFFKKCIPDATVLKNGFIIGKVTLVDCIPVEEFNGKISKQEITFGDYRPGRWAWVLENPIVLPNPIETPGKLSVWEYEMEERKEVAHA